MKTFKQFIKEGMTDHKALAIELHKKYGNKVTRKHVEDAIAQSDSPHKTDPDEVLHHVNKLVDRDEGIREQTISEAPVHAWQNRMKKRGAARFKTEKGSGPEATGHYIHAYDPSGKCVGKFDRVSGREVKEGVSLRHVSIDPNDKFHPNFDSHKLALDYFTRAAKDHGKDPVKHFGQGDPQKFDAFVKKHVKRLGEARFDDSDYADREKFERQRKADLTKWKKEKKKDDDKGPLETGWHQTYTNPSKKFREWWKQKNEEVGALAANATGPAVANFDPLLGGKKKMLKRKQLEDAQGKTK